MQRLCQHKTLEIFYLSYLNVVAYKISKKIIWTKTGKIFYRKEKTTGTFYLVVDKDDKENQKGRSRKNVKITDKIMTVQ